MSQSKNQGNQKNDVHSADWMKHPQFLRAMGSLGYSMLHSIDASDIQKEIPVPATSKGTRLAPDPVISRIITPYNPGVITKLPIYKAIYKPLFITTSSRGPPCSFVFTNFLTSGFRLKKNIPNPKGETLRSRRQNKSLFNIRTS